MKTLKVGPKKRHLKIPEISEKTRLLNDALRELTFNRLWWPMYLRQFSEQVHWEPDA